MATDTERRHMSDRRGLNNSDAAHRMTALDWVAITLLIIGGVNWGLIGLFSFDLVGAIFGLMSPLSRVIYTLVGVAALYSIYTSSKMARAKH